MIRAVAGPLISQPETWVLVFDRKASSHFLSFIAFGRYKHVRAYGYVPFLHVWLFYDPHWSGKEMFVAADGEPARRAIAQWIATADLMRFRPLKQKLRPPLFGWCVPSIARLIGLRCGALRCDALWRCCLRNGGEPFERQ